MNNFLVFSGTATQYLTEKICKSLGVPQGQINITRFADGEFSVSVSGLSYVRAVLKNDSFNATAKNAVCALYNYYAAAVAYLAYLED